MFMRGSIAMFGAAVVLMTGTPAMAQSSDLLASAERVTLAMAMGAEQNETIIRRPRSTALVWTGAALIGRGITLVTTGTWGDRKTLWATTAVGAGLIAFGLRSVEVPVRLDVAPGGFRVTRSLDW